MKAIAIIAAALLMLSGAHLTLRLAGQPVAVPLPVLALAAEMAAAVVLCGLIRRAARDFPIPSPLPWRTA